MRNWNGLNRRDALRLSLLAMAAGTVSSPPALAAGSINFADIGVGDPGGDWSKYKAASGYDVNLVSIGNAPSAILNVLVASGGQGTYDIINIVGGMQKPLVENDLVEKIDTTRLPNWSKDTYLDEFLGKGKPGFKFIGLGDDIYGVPTVLQGDTFAYLPEKTGKLDSYAALFDPQWKGYVALEDNYTTAAQKTALYLKSAGLASIGNPDDMTKDEFKAVIDFLIDQKKKGQFRVIWNSFEQAVNLITSKEVYVIDCWEPMVFVAKSKGVDAVYADPKEGYLLWAMAAYLVKNPNRSDEQTAAAYQLLDFMLGGWYGAKITNMRGYMTNPQAPEYAKANPSEFPAEEAQKVTDITDNVRRKFQQGGTWQNRWPTEVEFYESEWSRFKAADRTPRATHDWSFVIYRAAGSAGPAASLRYRLSDRTLGAHHCRKLLGAGRPQIPPGLLPGRVCHDHRRRPPRRPLAQHHCCRRGDRDLAAASLPDCLFPRPQGQARRHAYRPCAVHHSVSDQLHRAECGMDRPPRAQWHSQQHAHRGRPRRCASRLASLQQFRCLSRARLDLHAFHDLSARPLHCRH
jgi:putative spermidine/putrescine transport system substrate-binding protein